MLKVNRFLHYSYALFGVLREQNTKRKLMKSYSKWLCLPLAVIVIGSFCFNVSPAEAVEFCGGYQDVCPCGAWNPYPCSPDGCGNCTWWAWHKACCEWNVGLPPWGDAIDW